MIDLKGKIAIGVLCAILGLVIAMQFQTVREATGGNKFLNQRAQHMAIELRNLRNEKEKLDQELEAVKSRLREYEISEADESIIMRNLKEDLSRYHIFTGSTPVQGPGITITIDDFDDDQDEVTSFLMYNYEILLDLVNELNAAGAEAIAINNQRLLSTTGIHYFSNAVMINSVPTFPPFRIVAIGNPQALEASLNMRFGIIWNIKQEKKLTVFTKQEDNVILPIYSETIDFKYAKPIEITQ
ncbi:MAG: DUF881 domain-containing protein [Alkaliphilus sp.]